MRRLFTQPVSLTVIRTLIAAVWLLGPLQSFAQTEVDLATQYVQANADKQKLTAADVNNLLVSSAYRSPSTGWYHVYFNQAFESVEVYNRLMSVVIINGQVAHLTHNFVPNLNGLPVAGKLTSRITPVSAIQSAVADVGLSAGLNQLRELTATNLIGGQPARFMYEAPGLTNEKMEVKLYWLPIVEGEKTAPGKLALTWNVKFLTLNAQNSWSIHVDATTGVVLRKVDEVIHCSFGPGPHQHEPGGAVYTHSAQKELAPTGFVPNGYNVFDYPLESPGFGSRTTSVSPYNRFVPAGTGPGTTNGWHNDGTTDYTTTRGNNVWAQEDANNNNGTGVSPTSATLDFDYPYTLGPNTAAGNQDAAITNLFYWNNLIHDVLYKFGFDEPSGNFQQNNQGRGGAGNDYVFADAQDGGGTNNANFSTPADGSNGRMQMYLWTGSTYQPDGDFDNGIIAHEYGHGWSTRLTGGPANSSCLQNAEQGGEGWSDYLSLMLTTKWSSLSANLTSANIPRGIGTYALSQPTTGVGIRQYRYSYDMANVNAPVTYAKVGDASYSQPHGIGSIWATMLWDVTWEIILFDNQITADIYTTPSSTSAMRGNVAALKLVLEGLRLQPCSPSFVQARDAILQADQMLFGGRYRCAIGKAFARRGLGANASTGISTNDRIVTEDYTPIGGTQLNSATSFTACSNAALTYTATTSVGGTSFTWNRPAVTGISNTSATGSSASISEILINTTSSPVTVVYNFFVSPNTCAGTPFPVPVQVIVNPAVMPSVGSYSVCQDGSVPGGQGLAVAIVNSTSVTGQLTTTSPTYTRGSGDNTTVYVADRTVYYQSFTVIAGSTGAQTFETTAAMLSGSGNPDDTYLSLYQTSFNPASPATNFLHGDDDNGAGFLSSFTHTLTAGVTYIVVVSAYFTGTTGSFTLESSAPLFSSGTPNWFTASTGGSPLLTGSVFNPVGVSGSGLPNTNMPGTSTFYVSTPRFAACRRTTTFTVQSTAAPIVSSTTIALGANATLNATGCSGAGDVVSWYQTNDNAAVTMPVSPSVTTQYYARCQRTTNAGACLSIPSANGTVTVTTVTFTSFNSVASGNWNTPATWNCNCVPDGTLPVQIMNAHIVTVPDAYTGQAKTLKMLGTGNILMQGTGKLSLLN